MVDRFRSIRTEPTTASAFNTTTSLQIVGSLYAFALRRSSSTKVAARRHEDIPEARDLENSSVLPRRYWKPQKTHRKIPFGSPRNLASNHRQRPRKSVLEVRSSPGLGFQCFALPKPLESVYCCAYKMSGATAASRLESSSCSLQCHPGW